MAGATPCTSGQLTGLLPALVTHGAVGVVMMVVGGANGGRDEGGEAPRVSAGSCRGTHYCLRR